MIRITSHCGCFTDKRAKVQGKCPTHARNKVAEGFSRVEVHTTDVVYTPVAA